MTHCFLGAMNEVALWIAENSDGENSLEEASETITNLLEGLKK